MKIEFNIILNKSKNAIKKWNWFYTKYIQKIKEKYENVFIIMSLFY